MMRHFALAMARCISRSVNAPSSQMRIANGECLRIRWRRPVAKVAEPWRLKKGCVMYFTVQLCVATQRRDCLPACAPARQHPGGRKVGRRREVGHCNPPAASVRSLSQCVCEIIQSRRRVPPVLGSWGVCLGKAANGAGLLRAQLRIMASEQKVLDLPQVAHGRAARVPKRVADIQQMDTETVGLLLSAWSTVAEQSSLSSALDAPMAANPTRGQNPGKNCEAGTRTRVHSARNHALPWNARARTPSNSCKN
jgi:hypothetical protein